MEQQLQRVVTRKGYRERGDQKKDLICVRLTYCSDQKRDVGEMYKGMKVNRVHKHSEGQHKTM